MSKYKTKVEEILNKLEIYKAPIPIVDIANSYGFIVVEAMLENDEAGFLMIDKDGVMVNGEKKHKIICINHTDSPLRKRFTIAHELGHFFLEIEGKKNIENFIVHREIAEKTDKKKEREADLFASELLVPTSFLEKELNKLTTEDLLFFDVPYHISRFFQVSRSCAEIRYEQYKRGKHE